MLIPEMRNKVKMSAIIGSLQNCPEGPSQCNKKRKKLTLYVENTEELKAK